MMCGDFWIYSGLHMPLWDGGDCRTLATFVYIFTVVGFCFTAGSVIGMCRNGHLLYSVFCLVFGIVISPFILYMLAGIEVAGLLFLLGWAILGLVVLLCSCCCRNQDKKAEEKSDNSSSSKLSRVRIDIGDVQKQGTEIEETIHSPRQP